MHNEHLLEFRKARSQARSLWPALLSALVGARWLGVAERNTAMTSEVRRVLEEIITRLVTEKDDALYTKRSVCWTLADEFNTRYSVSHPSLEETREK
jgi:hypothetical protein